MVEFSSFSMVNLVFGCRLLMCWKNCSRLHLRRWRILHQHGVPIFLVEYLALVMAVVSIDIM